MLNKKTLFMNKYILLFGFALLITQVSCKTEKHHEEEKERVYTATSPIIKDTTIIKEYVSQIRSIQHIEIRALEQGYLQDVFVDEGQLVKKGQKLFLIMPVVYQAEYEKAKAEVEYAEIEYKNTKRLADSNIVSLNELALSKANLSKAQADLKLAEVRLSFTDIRAPFDGYIDRFKVRKGSLLDDGDILTNLSDNSKMWVYFNVPEAEYLNYMEHNKGKVNQKVNLIMANNQPFNYPGEVQTIEADFNNETGNIAFRATFPNPDKLLRHGETGNLQIPTPIKGAIIIPQKCTFELLQNQYVYVVDKDNVVKARKITVANELPHLYIVSEGLKETDKILIGGLRHVRNGDKVKINYIEPTKAMSQLDLYAE